MQKQIRKKFINLLRRLVTVEVSMCNIPPDPERKLNVLKTYQSCLGRPLDISCLFHLRTVSSGLSVAGFYKMDPNQIIFPFLTTGAIHNVLE